MLTLLICLLTFLVSVALAWPLAWKCWT